MNMPIKLKSVLENINDERTQLQKLHEQMSAELSAAAADQDKYNDLSDDEIVNVVI